jgi:hypothetical protein
MKHAIASNTSGIPPAANATWRAARGAAGCAARKAMAIRKGASVEATSDAGIVCAIHLRVKSMTISPGSRERYSMPKASP